VTSRQHTGDRLTGSIVVLGGGTMGRGIAAAALRSGLETTVVDVDRTVLETAREAIERRLERDVDAADASERMRGLHTVDDLEAAVPGATAVIEAVPEVADLKLDVFRRLGAVAPREALLASNTSTMSISRLAETCGNASRVIGMHFFNPVHRMALVEIVVAPSTSEAAVHDALALAETLGKDPIVVKDVPGFVTSRLGLLLGNEAMRMVEEGIASPGDIDKALRRGYGHPMGPLELADLVGLDARLNNVRSMYEQSQLEQYRPPAILERLVAAGRLGRKTGSGFYRYDEDGRRREPMGDLS
jgi:3-hydroxybutyryl-CoA dehydrogenase